MSERNLGKNNPFYGRKHSEETKEKLRKTHQGPKPWLVGKKLSEEHKKKLSEVRRKKMALGKIKVWNKGKKTGRPSPMRGKNHSQESNEKNRLAHIGQVAWNKGKKTGFIPWNKGLTRTFHHTEEAKSKIRERRATQVFPTKDSLPEIKINGFLNQLNLIFQTHKYIKIEHGYQCDFFIPSLNLVIECDGDYWHGNKDNPRFRNLNKYQIKTMKKDNLRTQELIKKGFNVLRLWESDIENMTLKDFIVRIKPFEKV